MVDHRLTDHGATRHAAEEAGGDVRDALAAGLEILVRSRLSHVVEKLCGEQRLQQTDDGEGNRERQNDAECPERERHIRKTQEGKGAWQLTHVAHGWQVEAYRHGEACKQDDGDQWRRHRSGEAGEPIDDHEASAYERKVEWQPRAIGVFAQEDVRNLGEEDEDGKSVHEPDHHGARNEAHQRANSEVAEADLEYACQHGGGK